MLVLGKLVTLAATVETEAIPSTVGIPLKNELDSTDSSFSVLLTHFSTTLLLLQQVQSTVSVSVIPLDDKQIAIFSKNVTLH